MATLTVTATPEPSYSPPRVRVDITDTGNSPAITSVTVTRTVGGETAALRSNDGNPLQLTPSGDDRTGVIYDYEAPFGEEVVYSTIQQPDNTSATVVSDSDVPWLTHPGQPTLSRPITLRIGSFATRRRAVRSGVFYPLGRDTAVVITDGRRKAPESSFTVSTETPAELEALLALIEDAGVLLLNVPPHLGLLIDTAYIAVLDVDEVRLTDIGEDPQRDWVMPYVEVAMPVGGTPTGWLYADAMARFATYEDAIDEYGSYADSLEPVS